MRRTTIADAPASIAGSFRDPSGRVFTSGGRLFRRIDASYAPHYRQLLESGLYRSLVDQSLLVPHEELTEWVGASPDAFAVIEPERIPFISYPFEWAPGHLRAAALATLRIQRLAVEHGMVLKDATAYNVQFKGSAPVFIDTLSFERWEEGTPWVAYRQFCQHFLGPSALMSRSDARLGALSRVFIDGAPLDLVDRLLPLSSRLTPGLLIHLHLHARAQARHGRRALPHNKPRVFGRRSMLGLIDQLESAIEGLDGETPPGAWVDYYKRTNYSAEAMAGKRRVVASIVSRERPAMVWDLGSNTGAFARVAAEHGAYTVAFDADYGCIDRLYAECRCRADTRLLPLVMDMTNPSGRIGWGHEERFSLIDRGPADLVLALGLIHHLYFANHVPFAAAARFFRQMARTLLIEFVPRTDSQVIEMTSRMPQRRDGYTIEEFERVFAVDFNVVDVVPLRDSARRIYVMRRRESPA
jgi:hypothetical protein